MILKAILKILFHSLTHQEALGRKRRYFMQCSP